MIPLDSIDLNTVLINPPCFEKLDTVNGKFKRQQNSTEAKPKAHCPLTGECPGKGRRRCVDPGAIVEEKFQLQLPDFQKTTDAKPKQQLLLGSHQLTETTKINSEKLPTAGLHSL
ncbi:MAG TPA: hypothetical protein VIU12_03795 [Chryseolinea sp.]|jgi:hypothetical protein